MIIDGGTNGFQRTAIVRLVAAWEWTGHRRHQGQHAGLAGRRARSGGPMEHLDLYIDGRSVPSGSGRTYQTIDPYAGQPWAQVADGTAQDVDRAVAAARAALSGPWGAATATERGDLLRRLARLIAEHADRLADIEVRDGGKLLREMSGQARGLPAWYTYFAGLAETLQGEVIDTGKPNFLVYTRHEPVGVV